MSTEPRAISPDDAGLDSDTGKNIKFKMMEAMENALDIEVITVKGIPVRTMINLCDKMKKVGDEVSCFLTSIHTFSDFRKFVPDPLEDKYCIDYVTQQSIMDTGLYAVIGEGRSEVFCEKALPKNRVVAMTKSGRVIMIIVEDE